MEENEIRSMADAYREGKEVAARMLEVGSMFRGAFGVARELGYAKDTPAWDGAVIGAYEVFRDKEIIIDALGRVVSAK